MEALDLSVLFFSSSPGSVYHKQHLFKRRTITNGTNVLFRGIPRVRWTLCENVHTTPVTESFWDYESNETHQNSIFFLIKWLFLTQLPVQEGQVDTTRSDPDDALFIHWIEELECTIYQQLCAEVAEAKYFYESLSHHRSVYVNNEFSDIKEKNKKQREDVQEAGNWKCTLIHTQETPRNFFLMHTPHTPERSVNPF